MLSLPSGSIVSSQLMTRRVAKWIDLTLLIWVQVLSSTLGALTRTQTGDPDRLPLIATGLRKIADELDRQAT